MPEPLEPVTLQVADLAEYHRNPRLGDVDAIARSLDRLGQYKSIVVNRGTITGRPWEVLDGNHTLQAARRLEWDTIDAVVVDVDEVRAASIVAAANRTGDLGGMDMDVLAELLGGLEDLAGTGYDDEFLESIIRRPEPETPAPERRSPGHRPDELLLSGKGFKVPISEDELTRFSAEFETFVKDHGTQYGLWFHLLERGGYLS